MYFKRLEVNGFKSFANKTDIDFSQGVTAIVGPNGSGKSNVADAVRWVLGEQSAKVLRGSKMEDVIFNGTEKRKAQSYCEVSLIFDNTEKSLPIDFTEVVITRRMYRSGESEYLLNGSACRLKDISELLRDTGIGKEGYSIIGQGKVADILSSKGDERRAVFEEAAGIMKYKVRKSEAERKLERTASDLLRINDIVSELEERIGPLEEQRDKARTYLLLRDQLRDLEINAFLHQYGTFNEKREKLAQQLEAINDEAQQRTVRLEEVHQKIERKNIEAREIQNRLFTAQQELADTGADIERSEGQNNLLNERIKFLLEDTARLEKENAVLLSSESSSLRALEMLKADRADKDADLNSERAKLEDKEKELAKLSLGMEEQESSLEETKQQIMQSLNRLSDVKSKIVRLNTMKESIGSSLESIENALEAKEQDYRNAKEAADELDRRLEDRLSVYNGLKADEEDVFSKRRGLQQQAEAVRTRNEELQAQKHSTQSRLQMLEDMKRDYEGYQYSVKSILKACDKDRNIAERVCGVIAQLIETPQKIETAVEMALGAAMQNVVTETEKDAKYLIEYLRENKLGRATFLPVNAMKGRTLNNIEKQQLSQVKGCLGVASELIKYDARYKEIIENLLGRTVIAEDMDAGIELARVSGRAYKIVTLKGDAINVGGSMTGGSVSARNTGLLGRTREIDNARELLAKLEEEQKANRNRAEALLEEIRELKQRQELIYEKVRASEIEKARETERAEKLHNTLGAYEREIASLVSEKERLLENLAEIDQELGSTDADQTDIEGGRLNAQKKVAELQAAYNHMRTEFQAFNGEVSAMRMELAGKEHELDSCETEIKRLEADIDRTRRSIEENRNRTEANRLSVSEMQSDGDKKLELLRDKKIKIDELRLMITKLDADRLEADEDIQKLEQVRRDEEKGIEQTRERRHSAELQAQRIETDLENMQKRIWDDYELTYTSALEFRRDDFSYSGTPSAIQNIRKQILELGDVNVNAIEEYNETSERFRTLTEQKNDLEAAIEDLHKVIEDLETGMQRKFKEQFELINTNFKKIFSDLFKGGTAELVLEDNADVLNSNIIVNAQPPGKKLQTLSLLSGGEQALTAIAILLAMLKIKPTPFCILDEIESALDEANVYHFADYIRSFSSKTQFIVITHRKPTMESADVLFGVSMEEKGVSSLLSMKMGSAAKVG